MAACLTVFFFVVCILLVQDAPDELWEVLELEKLNLSLNSLKVLPPQLALLSNLVVLNLWGNQVKHLSAGSSHKPVKEGRNVSDDPWCKAVTLFKY